MHTQGSMATHHVYEPDLAQSSCLPYGWFLPAVHTLQAKHTALCVCVCVCVEEEKGGKKKESVKGGEANIQQTDQ